MKPNPLHIPGVHYFCDHRCWRCPLASQCAVGSEALALPQAPTPAGRVAAVLAISLTATLTDAMHHLDQPGGVPPLDEQPVEVHAPDASAIPGIIDAGATYARLAARSLSTVAPQLRTADEREALVRIEESCFTIASKNFRAFHDIHDPNSAHDATGTAKVALLLIDESTADWQTLRDRVEQAEPALAALATLRATLTATFPTALTFQRRGFDTTEVVQ